MKNSKRFLAMGLAATMVLGSSLAVFADDSTSGGSTGAGSTEGHVDEHVISVTLPTVADGETPFNYTVDPERLVDATDGTRYGSVSFTEDAKENGVYFLTKTEATEDTYEEVDKTTVSTPDSGTTYYTESGGVYTAATNLTSWDADTVYYTKTSGQAAGTVYDSKSEKLEAKSMSSADVNLIVEVAASDDANIELVDTKPGSDANDAQLYLALVVGDDTTVIKSGETVSKEVAIAGVDSNFKATWDSTSEKYVYSVVDNPSDWNTASFYLTGVASNASAKDVTVPTLTVTWKYEDPTEASTSPSLSATEISTSANTVTVSNGTVSGIVLTKADGTETTLTESKHYTIDGDVITFGSFVGNSANVGATVTVSFEEGGSATLTIE